ncbi:MAG: hypothetical protein GY717_05055 [Rhodobacteraceae bacterium]|nr:hypothetical protein [Paracoccaceae bacterium]
MSLFLRRKRNPAITPNNFANLGRIAANPVNCRQFPQNSSKKGLKLTTGSTVSTCKTINGNSEGKLMVYLQIPRKMAPARAPMASGHMRMTVWLDVVWRTTLTVEVRNAHP